jgi:hypothetical protein
MRNKIFSSIAVLAVAAVAVWNLNVGSKNGSMSDVMLANVEALADEIGPATGTSYDCVTSIQYGGIYPNRNCGTCVVVLFTYGSGLSTCRI